MDARSCHANVIPVARAIFKSVIATLLFWPIAAMASGEPPPMAPFRFTENGDAAPITLKETSRQERVSIFESSSLIATDAKARFLLCSFARVADHRGFSHILFLQADKKPNEYVLGFFSSENEDLARVFGSRLEGGHLISPTPGAVARILPRCAPTSDSKN